MHRFPSPAASAAPPAAPQWDHGRRLPPLTRFSAPWSGVTFRVPSLGPVFIPGLVQAASLSHADMWPRAKPCTSKTRALHSGSCWTFRGFHVGTSFAYSQISCLWIVTAVLFMLISNFHSEVTVTLVMP